MNENEARRIANGYLGRDKMRAIYLRKDEWATTSRSLRSLKRKFGAIAGYEIVFQVPEYEVTNCEDLETHEQHNILVETIPDWEELETEIIDGP